MRHVLFIPLEEITAHFRENRTNEVKIVVPEIWSGESADLEGETWKHTLKGEKNFVFKSSEFIQEIVGEIEGPFSISFASNNAPQTTHVHENHLEIYFSEHAMTSTYQTPNDKTKHCKSLKNGGLMIFRRGVTHILELSGFTLVIGVPSLRNDKKIRFF